MKGFITAAALLLGCVTFNAQLPANVPNQGLIGYWPFTGNANDLSGNGNHGTVNGAVLTMDRFSSSACAYSFNGTNAFISTSLAGVLGSNARTVSFWARTSSQACMSAVAWGGNSTGTRFNCGFNYGSQGAMIDGAYGAITYSCPTPAGNNKWHHYVFQMGAAQLSQVEVYQDGVLLTNAGTSYNGGNLLNTISNFNVHFGRIIYAGGHLFFDGQLDDIGIWNRTLSRGEISSLYSGQTSIAEDLQQTTEVKVFYSNGEIVLQDAYELPAQVRIFDIHGKQVYRADVSNSLSYCSVAGLSAGIYFVHIYAGNRMSWQKLLVNGH